MSQDQVKDADSTAEFKPLVQLQEVEVDSGEKDEKEIWKSKSRLYRYAADKKPEEWVTRGIGNIRFLKNNKSGQIRMILREARTLKVRMNHMVQPDAPLKPKAGQEEVCFQWFAKDYAEEDPWEGLFAVKFQTQELAQEFKKHYDDARRNNKSLAVPSLGDVGSKDHGGQAERGGDSTGSTLGKDKNQKDKGAAVGVNKDKAKTKENSASTGASEGPWRKLNRTFREHMDKDVKSETTAAADWSVAMSEYIIFAHKLRGDRSPAPARVKSSGKHIFKPLNVAFHQWISAQKDADLDKDWTPPIRDYIKHAQTASGTGGK